MRVMHKPSASTSARDEVLNRIAHLERSLSETKQREIVRPWRTSDGSAPHDYYAALHELQDMGLVAPKLKDQQSPSYHLTGKGWNLIGGRPLWI